MSDVPLTQAEPPLVLALDVGTSSCRAGLYDARARRVAGIGPQVRYSPATTAEGGAELDADRLVEQVREVIEGAVAQAGNRLDAVKAVATCTFWHSLLGLDAEGRALTPIYLWMDARSRAEADELKRRLDERAVHARTGCVLHWSYWPAKLLWLSRTWPDLFRSVRRWVSFGEYLTLRLRGQDRLSVSMASGTGLLNQHTCDWDDELLGELPVGRETLGTVGGTEGRRDGETSSLCPSVPLSVPWLPPAGDGGCSNLGAGCATRERLALMVGTSGAMRVCWRADPAADSGFEIPWGAWWYRADRQRPVVGGAINDGGSLLEWLRETLRLPPLEELESAVGTLEPDGHGLTLLPLWAGERSPGWASDARGAIVGLRLHTGPVEVWRAALEAIALYFAHLHAIVRHAVPEAREVIATGGALLPSPAWMQIMADALGQPVLASAEPEASSRGAALLALESLGALPGGIEAIPPKTTHVFEPVPSHTERYAAALERQQRLYEWSVVSGQ
jgi:gluconokinase